MWFCRKALKMNSSICENDSTETSTTSLWDEINPAVGAESDGWSSRLILDRAAVCAAIKGHIKPLWIYRCGKPHVQYVMDLLRTSCLMWASDWLPVCHKEMSLLRREWEQHRAGTGDGRASAVDYLSSRWRKCHEGAREWGEELGFCVPAFGEKIWDVIKEKNGIIRWGCTCGKYIWECVNERAHLHMRPLCLQEGPTRKSCYWTDPI